MTLKHVLWLGGGTDAGKTTVAQLLTERSGLRVYHYDSYDVRDHRRLEALNPEDYGATFTASIDTQWLEPTPETLAARAQRSFRDRFPFVLQDLLELAPHPVVAEGFGLTPELVAPLLGDPQRGLWLVPTPTFKRASMLRRQKPLFAAESRDPERAFDNLYTRDLLLTAEITRQAQTHGLRVLEVNGSQSPKALTEHVAAHFGL